MHIIEKVYCYSAKPLEYYFYVKTKISLDFQICVSVPSRKPKNRQGTKAFMKKLTMKKNYCLG